MDRCRVVLKGGDGGKGCISHVFLSSKRPKTVDGGNGGSGGDVILRAISGKGRHGGSDSLNLDSFHVNAGRGINGSGNGKTGRNGKSVYLDVPVGTVAKEIIYESELDDDLYDSEFEEYYDTDSDSDSHPAQNFTYGRTFDLCNPGDEFIAAKGGRGGLGNIARDPRKIAYNIVQKRKAKEEREEASNAAAQADRESGTSHVGSEGNDSESVATDIVDGGKIDDMYDIEERMDADMLSAMRHVKGSNGETVTYELELKSIADIGLVGYPNAGKSTLLGCVSRARPAVAPYPFTTLHPFVGIVEFRDGERISVADIPGLVDGAAERNAGLGHSFLRHIERTRALAYVVDVGSGLGGDMPLQDDSTDGFDQSLMIADMDTLKASIERASIQLTNLRCELDMYAPGMGSRPSVVIANKLDTIDLGAVQASLGDSDDGAGEPFDIMSLLSPLGACVSNNSDSPATVIPLSARSNVGIRPLVRELRALMESLDK